MSPETGFVVEPRNIHGLIDCISKIEENGKATILRLAASVQKNTLTKTSALRSILSCMRVC